MSMHQSDMSVLFQAALDIEDEPAREAFLSEKCGANLELRAELDEMLRVHAQAVGFLSRPPRAINARQLACTTAGRKSVLASLCSQVGMDGVAFGEDVSGVRESADDAPGGIGKRPHVQRYQLQGEIARGGMGAILKGRDVDLGRNLAVKVLLEEHKAKPEIVSRFIEEAQIGGQLQHPGIAPVYELGQFPDQRPFFSMKLVKGDTLAAMLNERKNVQQSRSKLLGIFEQVCQTMAYAHSRRVIHRDLKPANMMVGAFGEVQVMDWGLAKVLANGGIADEKRARDTKLGQSLIQTIRNPTTDAQASVGTKRTFGSAGSDTQFGSVMGTPAYMPPEQALGEVDRLDERVDVFGLGAVLCEILTGKPPYVSDDSAQIFRMATRGKLEECHQRLDSCGADQTLQDLVRQCLEPEPTDRPRNAGELSQRLTEYLESVSERLREAEVQRAAEAAKAVEERKRRKMTLALAASILLMLTVAGSGFLVVQQQQASARRASEEKLAGFVNQARLHQGLATGENLALRQAELEKAIASAQQAVDLAVRENVGEQHRKQAEALLAALKQNSAEVAKQLAQQTKNRQLQDRLQLIRLSHADSQQEFDANRPRRRFDYAKTNDRYREAFSDAVMNFGQLSPANAAKMIQQSEISESLISALDHWARGIPTHTDKDLQRAWMSIGNWKKAEEFHRKAVLEDPSDAQRRLHLATILAAKDDQDGYREFCNEVVKEFANSRSPTDAERACKACLITPIDLDLDRLPSALFEQALDDGAVSDVYLAWFWGTRGLLAYRAGNFEKAMEYAEESLAQTRMPASEPLALAVVALAQHALGHGPLPIWLIPIRGGGHCAKRCRTTISVP